MLSPPLSDTENKSLGEIKGSQWFVARGLFVINTMLLVLPQRTLTVGVCVCACVCVCVCIIFKINLLPQAIGMNGIWLLVSGGLAYTIGVIFYVLQNKIKYMHSIWHLWILVGSILHFLCIILYVL